MVQKHSILWKLNEADYIIKKMNLSKIKSRFINYFKEKKYKKIKLHQVFFILGILVLFFTNTIHEEYPDEFDNILGGWLTLKGLLIYRDWFTHHGPIPYFLASFVEVFSGQSFFKFRIFYSIFLSFFTLYGYYFIAKSVGKKFVSFYPLLLIFLGFLSTYYWLHMLLADSFSALSLLPVYTLIFIKSYYKKALSLVDLVFVSGLLALAFYSSLAYIYLLGILFVFTIYEFYLYTPFILRKKESYYPILIFAAPHIFYFLYLLLTGSLSNYLYQAITFNTQFYIYNYPRPEGQAFINPVRYAVVIAYVFLNEFYNLILGAFKFEFAFPMNLAMAIGNVTIAFFLILKKKYKLLAFVLLTLIYANSRSNPLKSKETDYQSAVYIILSFVNIFFVLPRLYKNVNITKDFAKKAAFSFLMVILSIHLTFASMFVLRKYGDKIYPKYMGDAPLIYDRPEIAPIINRVLTKDDYSWIGPFEFEELFYTNSKPATQYQILIPGMGKSQRIQQEMLMELNQTRPKIIFFDKNFFILGNRSGDYSQFFTNFLNANYATLLEYKDGNKVYRSVAPIGAQNRVDIETMFYIRKDIIKEIIKKLQDNGYIYEKIE